MHEISVAESIIDTIIEKADELGKKPLSATISCGQMNSINDEVMDFAFAAASKDTVCEGMRLKIIHNPLFATCRKCENNFEFDIYSPLCPACDSIEFNLQPDSPLLLEEIEFED